MRGGRNMGRGGGRGGRQNNSMPSGSLVSEQLRDLDLELELLKRKREMIEQQQNLYQPFKKETQKNYNQQSYSYNENIEHGSSNHDFSYLYDDGPQRNRKPFPKKRPADSNWQHDSYPKKSAIRGRGYSGPPPSQMQKSFANANQPKRNYVQAKPSIDQRSLNQQQHNLYHSTPNRSFVPNKVTKPIKASAPSNKIAPHPKPERKRVRAAMLKSLEKLKCEEDFRLLPDKEPSVRMRGRMEMCLGAILSNVRELYAGTQHAVALGTIPVQRILKQCIRDRVRAALLGKIIGTTKDVINEYREMFPKESDYDVINETLKIAGLEPEEPAVEPLATKKSTFILRPHDYYKENMIKLITDHLHEMFNKVDLVYNELSERQGTTEDISEIKFEMDTDNKDEVAKDETSMNTAKMDENKVEGDTKKDKDSVFKTGCEDQHKLELSPNTYKMMLPRILKRHIPAILNLLKMNKAYMKDAEELSATTRVKYVEYGKEKEKLQSNLASVEPEVAKVVPDEKAVPPKKTSPKKTSPYALPYYVKLMGKPQLPKKKAMQPFLEQFNPKSIKKHRTIHSLLFIGLTEKNDFDAILGANGTVIGRSTLSIRVCGPSKEKEENNTTENMEDKPNSSADEVNQTSDNSKDITEANADSQDNIEINSQDDTEQIEQSSEGQVNDSNTEQSKEENITANKDSESLAEAEKNENTEIVNEIDTLNDPESKPQEAISEP